MKKVAKSALHEFASDESGQASAELIIIIAALVAVAAILVNQMISSGKTGSAKVGESVNKTLDLIEDAMPSSTP